MVRGLHSRGSLGPPPPRPEALPGRTCFLYVLGSNKRADGVQITRIRFLTQRKWPQGHKGDTGMNSGTPGRHTHTRITHGPSSVHRDEREQGHPGARSVCSPGFGFQARSRTQALGGTVGSGGRGRGTPGGAWGPQCRTFCKTEKKTAACQKRRAPPRQSSRRRQLE